MAITFAPRERSLMDFNIDPRALLGTVDRQAIKPLMNAQPTEQDVQAHYQNLISQIMDDDMKNRLGINKPLINPESPDWMKQRTETVPIQDVTPKPLDHPGTPEELKMKPLIQPPAPDWMKTKPIFVDAEGNKAKSMFGITNNPIEAGYILDDGTMLDFSGRNNGYVGRPNRNTDHREIHKAYPDGSFPDGTSGTEEMMDFVSRGNVRMQENGIELAKPLTDSQKLKVIQHINNNRGESFNIDFQGKDGEVSKSLSYQWPNVKTHKIMQDIESYFKGNK